MKKRGAAAKYRSKKTRLCPRCGSCGDRCPSCGVEYVFFDSLTEADYFRAYIFPCLRARRLSELKFHPSWTVAGVNIVADFGFYDHGMGRHRYIDVKGIGKDGKPRLTAQFRRNQKMLRSIGIELEAVGHRVRR